MLWEEGFHPNSIGPHSIQASGAMALYLNNVPEATIRLMGWWQSKTWTTYIHTHIAAFSASLSRRMVQPVLFHNIAGRAPL